MDWTYECALFVAGLVFGSFLNVCISRLPRGQSIVTPGSRCPKCGASLRWYHNIPLASWVLLRGRCRNCGERISWRYPAVELLNACLFAACFAYFGVSWLTLKFCIFCFLLLGLVFMDAETGLLPRAFTYPGIVLGLALAPIAPTDTSGTEFLLRAWQVNLARPQALALLDACLGAMTGAGFLYLAWALYYLVRKRHGMGFGDIALMATSGAFLGLKLTLLVIFFAPLLGVLYALVLLLKASPESRDPAVASSSAREMFLTREIPFGVFLGSCSLLAVFLGAAVWRWYLDFFR